MHGDKQMKKCNRRHFLHLAAGTTLGMMTCGSLFAQPSGKKPNVLFVAIDDLRPELGCYGADYIKSPNIDAFAKQGVLFERAYCQAPHCAPSRSSLLTGVHTRSIRGFARNPGQIAPGKITLPATFREAGYYTVGNGKIYHSVKHDAKASWSESPFSLVNGPKNNNHLTFHDEESANYIGGRKNRGPWFEAPDVPDNAYIDGQTCEKVIKDLRHLAKMDKPFFLTCGFVRPHLPFYAPKKYWDMYDRDTIEIADNRYRPENAPGPLSGSGEVHSYHNRGIKYNSGQWHKIGRHGYYACVSYVDALVGKLLAELDELGLRDNTIVVVWGDHGWNLGEHNFWGKHNLLHNSIRAPLIISAPGFQKGVKTDAIVELVDIYPTLCELAGIEQPEHLAGKSIAPNLRDPQAPGKGAAFATWKGAKFVITRDYTYTEYHAGKQRMLYDHTKDPEENVNVAEKPEYAETVRKLHDLLQRGSQ